MLEVVHRHVKTVLGLLFVSVLVGAMSVSKALATSSAEIVPKVTVRSSLTVSIPDYSQFTAALDPANTSFEKQDLTISMSTNNPSGYKMFVDTVGDSTELVNTSNPSYTIPNITTSVNPDDFPMNYWGFRITKNSNVSTGDFVPFSPHSIVSESNGPAERVTSTVGFGAKVDYSKPAGMYQIRLKFEIVPTVTQTYMQNLDSTVCKTTPALVIDQRDEQLYTIQRLADGKCWMIDNLNLDLTDTGVVNLMSSTNTNASSEVLGYLKNSSGGRANGDQYPTAGLTYENWADTPSYDYSQPLVNKGGNCSTTSSDPCTYDGAYKSYNNLSNLTPLESTFGYGSGKVGIYYNYCAASAGSYCYGSGASAGTPSGSASYDICPAGWRMPTGGVSGEYQSLANAESNNLQNALSALFSGNYHDGAANGQGVYGYFWSSTNGGDAQMSSLRSASASVDSSFGADRAFGNSVRCVLKES